MDYVYLILIKMFLLIDFIGFLCYYGCNDFTLGIFIFLSFIFCLPLPKVLYFMRKYIQELIMQSSAFEEIKIMRKSKNKRISEAQKEFKLIITKYILPLLPIQNGANLRYHKFSIPPDKLKKFIQVCKDSNEIMIYFFVCRNTRVQS